MKKTICVILSIVVIILMCIYMNFKQVLVAQNDAKKFNLDYEFYNKESVLGTDITTLINKAFDNNEKYEIKKDENGIYLADDLYSIKIYVYMIINDTTYPMESLKKTGLQEFTKYFGQVEFKCTNVKYHEKTGRIAEMTFSALEK